MLKLPQSKKNVGKRGIISETSGFKAFLIKKLNDGINIWHALSTFSGGHDLAKASLRPIF